MSRRVLPTFLSAAAGLALVLHLGAAGAQSILAVGTDAEVTADGLHRVSPLLMEAAWVKPEFDLSGYQRLLLMPTAVQFRDVPKRSDDARTRAMTEIFPLEEERQNWLRNRWRDAVEAQFTRDRVDPGYTGDVSDVLVIQGFLVDVVSRIPPVSSGSLYTIVTDPWSATLVVELRDAATAELIARTVDRRNARGMLEVGAVWHSTEALIERWAGVMADRLDELSVLGGRPRWRPDWVLEQERAESDAEEMPSP